MNDHRLACIGAALSAGLRVGYIAPGAVGAAAFEAVCSSGVVPAGARVLRTYGQQRIEAPNGGCLMFFRSVRAVRGQTLDVAYVVGGAVDDTLDVFPSLAGSRVRELVLC